MESLGKKEDDEDDDECLRLKRLISVEQHRFICERIELQDAQKQLALLSSEIENLKNENLYLLGKSERNKYKNMRVNLMFLFRRATICQVIHQYR